MFWKTALALGLFLLLAGTALPAAEQKSYIQAEVKGTLETGVVAIGGETTGTVVKTRDGTVELDLSKDKALKAQAEKLNGKLVVVSGKLVVKAGVEVPHRLIVIVSRLEAAD